MEIRIILKERDTGGERLGIRFEILYADAKYKQFLEAAKRMQEKAKSKNAKPVIATLNSASSSSMSTIKNSIVSVEGKPLIAPKPIPKPAVIAESQTIVSDNSNLIKVKKEIEAASNGA